MESSSVQDQNIARRVGLLEAYSTSRHSLGFYLSVAQTARYSVSKRTLGTRTLESVIENAVAQAILAHPILQVGIVGEDTQDPCFVYLPSLDLARLIRWEKVDAKASSRARDEKLQQLLEGRHSSPWEDISRQPGYEFIVLQPSQGEQQENLTIDILFAWHHALGDGTSGAILQSSLLRAMNKPVPIPAFSPSTHILTITTPSPLPPPQESLINFSISWPFFFKTLWAEFAPKFLRPAAPEPTWTGLPISLHPTQTRLRLLNFPAETLSDTIQTCKKNSTTLTPLIHILLLTSLSKRVPEAAKFASTTPISLRRLLSASGSPIDPNSTMGVILTSQTHHFPSSAVYQSRSGEKEQTIWSLACSLGSDLKRKVASLPHDDALALLPWAGNLHKWFSAKLGRDREYTWEVSNVGAVDMAAGGGGEWTVDRIVFSQSGSVAGSAIGVNVAAVKGGELAITLSWKEGIVQEEVMDGLAADLELWLGNLAKTGHLA